MAPLDSPLDQILPKRWDQLDHRQEKLHHHEIPGMKSCDQSIQQMMPKPKLDVSCAALNPVLSETHSGNASSHAKERSTTN